MPVFFSFQKIEILYVANQERMAVGVTFYSVYPALLNIASVSYAERKSFDGKIQSQCLIEDRRVSGMDKTDVMVIIA